MKKLEKVGENKNLAIIETFNKTINEKLVILNQAYNSKNAVAVDNASKDLLEYLEKVLTKKTFHLC